MDVFFAQSAGQLLLHFFLLKAVSCFLVFIFLFRYFTDILPKLYLALVVEIPEAALCLGLLTCVVIDLSGSKGVVHFRYLHIVKAMLVSVEIESLEGGNNNG